MFLFKDHVVLVIAPHPDDEVLGCGGLIKRVKDEGGKVYVLFMTVGNTKDYSEKGFSTIDERISEIENVANYLKYDGWKIAFPGDQYHLKLDFLPQKEIIGKIENDKEVSLNAIKPTIIATTKINDYNQDHRACAQAVFSATRPAPAKSLPGIVLGYDSVVTGEWGADYVLPPNFFLELKEEDLKVKTKALNLYSSQIRNGAHQRSAEGIKTIARFRGIQCGKEFAESYYVYRQLI